MFKHTNIKTTVQGPAESHSHNPSHPRTRSHWNTPSLQCRECRQHGTKRQLQTWTLDTGHFHRTQRAKGSKQRV